MIELGKLGLDCLILSDGAIDLGRACHCVSATLATLAANAPCARMMMDAPGGSVIRSVLALVEVGAWHLPCAAACAPHVRLRSLLHPRSGRPRRPKAQDLAKTLLPG